MKLEVLKKIGRNDYFDLGWLRFGRIVEKLLFGRQWHRVGCKSERFNLVLREIFEKTKARRTGNH